MFPKVVQVITMENCLDIDPDTLYELPFVNEQIA